MMPSGQCHRELIFILASAFLAQICLAQLCLAQTDPDTVFVNGKILTVDEDFSVVQALAVTGNEISAVGTTAEISVLAGAGTRMIDLDGKTLISAVGDIGNDNRRGLAI